MKTYYVIRSGWNSANQSSVGACRHPRNEFESHYYALVGIIEAESEAEAIKKCGASCYNGQSVWSVTNPRSVKGLTQAIRNMYDTTDCY